MQRHTFAAKNNAMNKYPINEKLKFEMMGNRLDDHVYRHILYEDYTQELEFGSILKALKYFKQSLMR